MLITDKQAYEMYLDWLNNYLTVARFAEDYGTTEEDARNIIYRGSLQAQRFANVVK